MQESNDSLLDGIKAILKWKKHIAIFVIISTLLGIIVSLLLKDEYESTAIFYPVNLAMTDRQMLFNEKGTDQYIDYFGTKNDVDRMISMAYSASIIDTLISRFNLQEHYIIDTTKKLWQWKVKEEFLNRYKVKKSEYSGIEIVVIDQNRQIAADIANTALSLINSLSKALIIENKSQILKMYEKKKEQKEQEVNIIADSLASLRIKYNIKELETPDGQIVMIKGDDVKAVENFKILLRRHMNAIKDLNVLTTIYEQHSTSVDESFSSVYIIQEAYPADKKAKPLRFLIVIGVFSVALFISVSGALMTEQFYRLKNEIA